MASTLKVPLNRRDHHIGPLDARVNLVEYGDYECPHCARADKTVERLIKVFEENLCYVFRHFPLEDIHPHAMMAALAAEAAGKQEKFWEMHVLLFGSSHALSMGAIKDMAEELDLDMDQFLSDMESEELLAKINQDLIVGQDSGVEGTPSFFLNGILLEGTDYESLKLEIEELMRDELGPYA